MSSLQASLIPFDVFLLFSNISSLACFIPSLFLVIVAKNNLNEETILLMLPTAVIFKTLKAFTSLFVADKTPTIAAIIPPIIRVNGFKTAIKEAVPTVNVLNPVNIEIVMPNVLKATANPPTASVNFNIELATSLIKSGSNSANLSLSILILVANSFAKGNNASPKFLDNIIKLSWILANVPRKVLDCFLIRSANLPFPVVRFFIAISTSLKPTFPSDTIFLTSKPVAPNCFPSSSINGTPASVNCRSS